MAEEKVEYIKSESVLTDETQELIQKLKSKEVSKELLQKAINMGLIKLVLKFRVATGYAYFKTIAPSDLQYIEDIEEYLLNEYGGGDWILEYRIADAKPPIIVYNETIRFLSPPNEKLLRLLRKKELPLSDELEEVITEPIIEKKNQEISQMRSILYEKDKQIQELQQRVYELEKKALEEKHKAELEMMQRRLEEQIKALEHKLTASSSGKESQEVVISKIISSFSEKITELIKDQANKNIEFIKTMMASIPKGEGKTEQLMNTLIQMIMQDKNQLAQKVDMLTQQMLEMKFAEIEMKSAQPPSAIDEISKLIEKGTEALQKLQAQSYQKIPPERMQQYADAIAVLCKERRYKEAVAQFKNLMAEMNYTPTYQEIVQLIQQWRIEITPEFIQEIMKEFPGISGLPILR